MQAVEGCSARDATLAAAAQEAAAKEARAAFQAEAAEKAMAQREAESAKQTATPAGGLRRRQPSAALRLRRSAYRARS